MSEKNDNKVPNVPNLRFSSSILDWELKPITTLIEECSETTSNFEKYPLYSFTIEDGVVPKSERYERSFLVKKDGDSFKVVKYNNFVMNPMNLRFGAISYSKVKNDVSVSGYYNIFNIDNAQCNDYWEALFRRTKTLQLYDSVATGSLLEKKRVHFSQFRSLKFYIPEYNERIKISLFFSKINERIDTQSKIIEDLELVKKGIYNHIFTQLNSVEKVLLEDLLIDFNKRTLTDKQYPILSSTLSGIYLQEDYFNKQAASASTEGYKIVPYGFATYRSMSDTGEFRFNLQTIVENGIVSPAYPVFTCIENYRLDFILFCLNYYDDIKKQLFSMKQGGTRLALHFNSLCKLYIPRINNEKQSKIMAIVNSYDAKSVTEKQILEKLKEQKKFLLSNMFI